MFWTSEQQPLAVTHDEITGSWGCYTLRSREDAYVPASVVMAAIKKTKVKPDSAGYYAFSIWAIGEGILILEPVGSDGPRPKLRADQEDRFPTDPETGLPKVLVHSSKWRWINVVSFPCEVVAWADAGKVYVRERWTAEQERFAQKDAKRRAIHASHLRTLIVNREGFQAKKK